MMKKKWLSGCLGLLCVITLAPMLLMATSSFTREGGGISLSPMPISIDQYLFTFLEPTCYWRGYGNSLMLVAAIIPVQLCAGMIVGFAFARGRFRGKTALEGLYTLVMLLPFQTTLLPNYLLMRELGLFDTWWAVCIPMWLHPMPAVILKRLIAGLDQAYFDEFDLNSASRMGVYRHVVAPMIVPGLLAVALLSFAEIWGMVELPMTMLSQQQRLPLAVFLNRTDLGDYPTAYYAGAVLFVLPPLMLYRLTRDALGDALGQVSIIKH